MNETGGIAHTIPDHEKLITKGTNGIIKEIAEHQKQAQLNVIDPEELKKARDNPDLYPNIVVRVSGYTVYFRDLAPAVQDEIIQRSTFAA